MKKISIIISILSILWYTFCNVIDYSNAFISQMHNEVSAIEIISPLDVDDDERLATIIDASKQTDSIVFCEYTSFLNVFRTKYTFYISSYGANKLLTLPGGDEVLIPSDGKALSNIRSIDNDHPLNYTNLLYDINIYDLAELSVRRQATIASTYFVDTGNLAVFSSYLQNQGYNIVLTTDSAANSAIRLRWDSFQLYCFFFIAICVLFHCFQKNKSIVVKKLNGFGIVDIIETEFKTLLLITLILIVLIILFFTIAFQYYWRCGYGYFHFSAFGYLQLSACTIASILLPALYSIFQRSACDIKRIRFPKLMQLVSFLIFSLVSLLAILSFSETTTTITDLQKQVYVRDLVNSYINDAFVLRFNNASSSIDLNINETENDCMTLYNNLNTESSCLFVDAISSETDVQNGLSTLFVNRKYFDLVEVYDADGIRISSERVPEVAIFIPGESYAEAADIYLRSFDNINEFKNDVVTKVYQSGQTLPILSPDISLSYNGFVHEPVLIVAEPSVYSSLSNMAMISAFSSDRIVVLTDDADWLWDEISDAGLNRFVSNITTVDNEFMDAIHVSTTLLLEHLFVSFVYLMMYVIACLFHSGVYFRVNSRMIAICRILGFGRLSIHKSFTLQKIAVFLIFFVVSPSMSINLSILLFMILFDVVQFYVCDIQFNKKDIPNIVKGELT